MVITVQMRKSHLLQKVGKAVSSVLPIDNPAALSKAVDRTQLNSIHLGSDATGWKGESSAVMPLGEKAKAAWSLRAATLWQSGEQQESLKPA